MRQRRPCYARNHLHVQRRISYGRRIASVDEILPYSSGHPEGPGRADLVAVGGAFRSAERRRCRIKNGESWWNNGRCVKRHGSIQSSRGGCARVADRIRRDDAERRTTVPLRQWWRHRVLFDETQAALWAEFRENCQAFQAVCIDNPLELRELRRIREYTDGNLTVSSK